MKTAAASLKTFLAANTTCYRARLFTITLPSGTVIRYTDGQIDIVFGGNTFSASAAQGAWKRGALSTSLGLQTATMNLEVVADSTATINGVAITAMIAMKMFHGAQVRCETLYMPTYGDVSKGSVVDFVGSISNVTESGRAGAKFVCRSVTHLLDVMIPRKLVQPGCTNTLFDAGCTLVKATFGVNKIVAGGSTQSLIIPSVAFAQADGYFTLGTIKFTSGLNTGVEATVKLHVGGQIQLVVPLPFTVTAGDAFTAFPGCDHLQATCSTKFSNLVNFIGMPYVPVPETQL